MKQFDEITLEAFKSTRLGDLVYLGNAADLTHTGNYVVTYLRNEPDNYAIGFGETADRTIFVLELDQLRSFVNWSDMKRMIGRDIDENILNNKEETIMTDYGKKLEKEYRDGMVVGAIYDFIGKGTGGWRYRYKLIGFEGCGEDLLLIFKSIQNDSEFRIMAADMGGFSLISKPIEEEKDNTDMKFLDEFDEIFDKKLRGIMADISKLTEEKSDAVPKPMQLVKKIEGYEFDEKAFYRATNGVRHFLIIDSDNDRYEALYYGPTLDKAGMHIAFVRSVGFTNFSCESAELYHDKIKCDPVWTAFKMFKGDSVCTPKEIKIDDIFKREEKLEWDIDKLKAGKAYRIRDIDGNETDGIYRSLYGPVIPMPGKSSILFTVVSDEKATGTYQVYQDELASGKIKIYELTCKKGE